MKTFLKTLARAMTPALILSYLALCVILLAMGGQGQGLTRLLSMLWAALMMVIMRWGIWGILKLALRRSAPRDLKILVRTVEVIQLLLIGGTAALAVLLWEIPATWLFLPAALFGLQGALKFDATYIV